MPRHHRTVRLQQGLWEKNTTRRVEIFLPNRRSHFCEPPASGARVVAAKARRMRAADAYRLRQGWRAFLLPGRQRQG